jgi:hypothetical protein
MTQAHDRRKAGHWEILGETCAKFDFFENGWNLYSRFLDFGVLLPEQTPGSV